jgi:hypothetical protein
MSNELKVVEFASKTEVSASMREKLFKDTFEDLLKEKLRKDAEHQGYTEVSEPVVTWQEQAFVYIDNGDKYPTLAKCNPDEPGAFYNVGVRMKVSK